MAYLNKAMLIGNVGKDPVVSVTPSGRNKVSFSIATSRRYKDSNGETKEQTDWHNVIGWGKTADVVEQLGIKKGTTLYVEGSINNRYWEEPTTGLKKSVTEINLDSFQVLTPRNSNGNVASAPASNPYHHDDPSTPPPAFGDETEDGDGLPF